jgi:hypothetical protein
MNSGALTYAHLYIESADRARGNTKSETQRAKAAIFLKLPMLMCDPKVHEKQLFIREFYKFVPTGGKM